MYSTKLLCVNRVFLEVKYLRKSVNFMPLLEKRRAQKHVSVSETSCKEAHLVLFCLKVYLTIVVSSSSTY